MTPPMTARYWAPGQFPSGSSTLLDKVTTLGYSAELRGPGGGTVEQLLTASNMPDSGGVVTIDTHGTRSFAGMCKRRTRVSIAGKQADQRETWELDGLLARYGDTRVLPPNGLQHVPRVDSFTYNFAHPGYIEPGGVWEDATEVCTVEYAQLNASNLPATVDVDGRWGYLQVWDPAFPQHAIAGVGSGTTMILWGSDGDPTGVTTGIGKRCFYEDITLPYDGIYYLFVGADNTFQAFLHAAPLTSGGSIPLGATGNPMNSSYSHTTIYPLTASAGEYRIAFVVENYPPFGAPNPGGLAAALYIPGYPPTLVWETTSAMRVTSDYVDELPGMTVNQVIRLYTESQQDEGRLSDVTLDFDDDTDSDGQATETLTNITVNVGRDSGFDLLSKIMNGGYADVRMPPTGWELQVYNIDTMVSDPSLTYDETNLTSLTHKTEAPLAASLLTVTDPTAWYATGEDEPQHFVELGIEVEPVEVLRLLDATVAILADERKEISLIAQPLDTGTSGDIPYRNADFVPGATVTAPWISGTLEARVMACGSTMTGNAGTETVQVAVTINDRIQSLNERVIEEVKVT